MTPESAAPAQELKLKTEKISEAVLVYCTGRIVWSTSQYLQDTVRPLIAENRRVALDLTNVSYLDSSGLGSIVGLWVNAKKNNCDLKLNRLNERIKELLRLSNLAMLEAFDRTQHTTEGLERILGSMSCELSMDKTTLPPLQNILRDAALGVQTINQALKPCLAIAPVIVNYPTE